MSTTWPCSIITFYIYRYLLYIIIHHLENRIRHKLLTMIDAGGTRTCLQWVTCSSTVLRTETWSLKCIAKSFQVKHYELVGLPVYHLTVSNQSYKERKDQFHVDRLTTVFSIMPWHCSILLYTAATDVYLYFFKLQHRQTDKAPRIATWLESERRVFGSWCNISCHWDSLDQPSCSDFCLTWDSWLPR